MRSEKITKFTSVILMLSVLFCSLSVAIDFYVFADETAHIIDYSELSDKKKLHIKDYCELGMYAGAGLNLSSGALVIDQDLSWQINIVDKYVSDCGAYAVYKLQRRTDFTAMFTSSDTAEDMTLYVSADAVTWKEAEVQKNDKSLTIKGSYYIAYVKIVWPINAGTDKGLVAVDFTKSETDTEICIDYATVTGGDMLGSGKDDVRVLINRGVWESKGLSIGSNGIIRPDWSVLDRAKTENSFNGYATYKVQPNTHFGLSVTSNRATDGIAEKLGYENPLDWNIEIYGSSDNEHFERINTVPIFGAQYANYQGNEDARRSAEYSFIVPDGVVYVKCKFPLTQNLSTIKDIDGKSVWPYVGNDLFEINRVEFNRLRYDYYKAGGGDYYIESEFSDKTKADFGIFSYGGSLNRSHNAGLFDTDWMYQFQNGLANTHAVYNVQQGTAFYACFMPIWQPNITAYIALKDYVIKVQGLDNETGEWVDAATLTVTKDDYDKNKKYYITGLTAEQNIYRKIKLLWPSKASDSAVGDDCFGLAEVAFKDPYEDYAAYGEYTDYNDAGVQKLDYNDIVYEKLHLYRYKGVVISKYENGTAYMGVSEAFVTQNAKCEHPYVVYLIQPKSEFMAVITRNKQKCEAMGEDWNIKLYESSDCEIWTERTIIPDTAENTGIGITDTYRFTAGESTQYVKIVFPHTKVVDSDTGAKAIGVVSVGLTPGEYGKIDPYGDHTFSHICNYLDEESFKSTEKLDALNKSKYNLYQLRSWSAYFLKGNGLQVLWDYLIDRTDVSKPYFSFNTAVNTAFQAEITFHSYWVDQISKKLGYDFLPQIYVSADHRKWEPANAIVVKMSESRLNPDKAGLVFTIDSIPDDMKFVKIEFPTTGDVSILTDGLFPYAGNDLMELASVSYSKGSETPPGNLDNGQYEIEIEETSDEEFSDNNRNKQYHFEAPTNEMLTITPESNYGLFEDDTIDPDNFLDGPTGPKIRKGKRLVRKVVNVIDGYYYPWWVWSLWIGGSVLFLATAVCSIVIIVKKKHKKFNE